MAVCKIVHCATHGKQPVVRICSHLANGDHIPWYSREVSDGREVEYDWGCRSCVRRLDRLGSVKSMCCVCVKGLLKQSQEG